MLRVWQRLGISISILMSVLTFNYGCYRGGLSIIVPHFVLCTLLLRLCSTCVQLSFIMTFFNFHIKSFGAYCSVLVCLIINNEHLRDISMLADTLILHTSTVCRLSSGLILPNRSCKQGVIVI